MSIVLFDMQNGKVIPSIHCYNIESFKKIIDEYPKDHTKIFAYFYYMSCLNEEENPFANVPEEDKEDLILKEVGGDFSIDDKLISEGLVVCKKLYETTAYNTYLSIKIALENLGKYLRTTQITDGRDGNVLSILKTAKDFEDVRRSFASAYRSFKEEEVTSSRGNQNLSYDSR
jgi:hypothetical protein